MAVLVLAAAPAGAERVTLGLPAPTTGGDGFICTGGCTYVQTASPNAAVTPPGVGRIVAWWALGGSTSGGTVTSSLRLVHSLPFGQFKAVGTSAPEPLGGTIIRFPTDLPTEPGDLLGETATTSDSHTFILIHSNANANVNRFATPFADGTTQAFDPMGQSSNVLELGAEFVYTPDATSVTSTIGSTAGGETVVIKGDHLTDSTSVRFGPTEATSFTIDSNTQITAVTPAEPEGGVGVSVSGPGGTSLRRAAASYAFIAPSATVSPATVDFGSVAVGSASGQQSVTVTNPGIVNLKISSAALTGADSPEFTALSNGCTGQTLAPGASCSVPLVYAPTAAGPHRATLRFDDTASDSPQQVVLVGNAAGGPASNAFTIGRLRGTRLRITVASNGTVTVNDAGVRAARKLRPPRLLRKSSASGGPGTLLVGLRLTSKARKALKRAHRVRVRARVTFEPVGGAPATKTVRLVVKSKRKRR